MRSHWPGDSEPWSGTKSLQHPVSKKNCIRSLSVRADIGELAEMTAHDPFLQLLEPPGL